MMKMTSKIRTDILSFLDTIETFSNNEELEDSFLNSLSKTSKSILIYYGIKDTLSIPSEITIKKIDEDIGVDVGLKIENEGLILSDWIYEEQIRPKKYLFYFYMVKSCFLLYYKKDFKEFDHIMINIILLLLIKELENISSIKNVFLVNIIANFFPEEIAGVSYQLWLSLLNLLVSNDISSKNVFDFYSNIEDISVQNKVKSFSNWVTNQTVKVEDVIAPIYVNWKLVEIIELLLKLGYEESTSRKISKTLKVDPRTIRSHFRGLTSSFNTFWRAVINFQKMNLHNYFINIELKDKKSIETLSKKLLENPYLKSLFQGENEDTNILYSPTFICPHLVRDNLSKELSNYKKKDLINNYSIQLVRRKIHYGTITSYPYKNTINNFESFIYENDENLRKCLFADEKRDFSSEFKDSKSSLDYNLLFFLSVLNGRFLTKGSYSVRINELEKLYEKNNLQNSTLDSKIDFLSQIEIRSRRRDVLSFSPFMLNFNRLGSDILIIDIPMPEYSQEKKLAEVIEKLRVFSFLGQMNVYTSIVLTIPGANHQHPIRNVIEKVFNDSNIFPSFYTIKIIKSKFIPYHELYDYDTDSWKV